MNNQLFMKKASRTGKETSMKTRMKTNIVLFLVALLFCLFFTLEAYAFRCGDEIIGAGDSKAKVLTRCGKPMLKEKVGAKKSTRMKGEKRGAADGQYVYHKKQSSTKNVEKWSYNCGKDDFIYVLTFEGGVVAKEETDGRGRGPSECLGK
jgi:hypothetical protein